MELSHILDELGITVEQLITVDTAIGFASGVAGASTDFVDRNNTSNVKINSNHYQSNSSFPVWSQGGKKYS